MVAGDQRLTNAKIHATLGAWTRPLTSHGGYGALLAHG